MPVQNAAGRGQAGGFPFLDYGNYPMANLRRFFYSSISDEANEDTANRSEDAPAEPLAVGPSLLIGHGADCAGSMEDAPLSDAD
jgi:hypothetical protein